jgi:hypothetical protein
LKTTGNTSGAGTVYASGAPGKNTTSTPAPLFRTSQLKLNVADVSEISSSEHETNV